MRQRLSDILKRAPAGRRFAVVFVLVCIFGSIPFASLPIVERLDESLVTARFGLSPQNEDFDSVIVAIDAKSLQADRNWPWSRAVHGALLDRLDRAGARAVAFDIDFSSRGPGDADFAAAMERAKAQVYLVGFRQSLPGLPDVYAEMVPNPDLLPHARIASAAFPASRDGTVRRMIGGEIFSFGPVPSLSQALAGKPADLDGPRRIDVAQRLDRLPVLSVADVLSGADIDQVVRGRTVLVGATAVELGDEFAIPLHGLVDGVVINALAYETARRDASLRDAGPWLFMLFVVVAIGTAVVPIDRTGLGTYCLVNLTGLTFLFVGATLLQSQAGIVVASATPHLFQFAGFAFTIVIAADDYGSRLFRSQMNRNKHAFLLDALMDADLDGLLTIDREGRVETLNTRAAQMLNVDAQEAVGRPLAALAPQLPRRVAENERRDVVLPREGADLHLSAFCTRVELPLSPSRYEKRRKPREVRLFVLTDITAQKMLERQEREAKEAHEAASKAKSVLIGMMTHELRTPLNSVIGFADMIAEQSLGADAADEYAEFGSLIGLGGRQLLAVIDDLLLASEIQSGTLTTTPEPLDTAGLLQDAIRAASTLPGWHGPTIRQRGMPLCVRADRQLVLKALTHLVHNAGKFAGPSATVTLSVEATAETVSVSVSDDGPGPKTDDLSCLRELFAQRDSARNRVNDGCGLGLFLTDHMARAMGGRLDLAAPASGGFVATLVLPRAKALDAAA